MNSLYPTCCFKSHTTPQETKCPKQVRRLLKSLRGSLKRQEPASTLPSTSRTQLGLHRSAVTRCAMTTNGTTRSRQRWIIRSTARRCPRLARGSANLQRLLGRLLLRAKTLSELPRAQVKPPSRRTSATIAVSTNEEVSEPPGKCWVRPRPHILLQHHIALLRATVFVYF